MKKLLVSLALGIGLLTGGTFALAQTAAPAAASWQRPNRLMLHPLRLLPLHRPLPPLLHRS